MEEMSEVELDLDTTAEEILLSATNHDTETLAQLLKKGSANVRDAETGTTPLHAAIAACEADDDDDASLPSNGDAAAQAITRRALAEEGAVRTVKLLLENGAIWNDLDEAGETPGCVALRLGLREAYALMVEAGVRAELLLNRLDGFEMLVDDDDDDQDEARETNGAERAEEAQEPAGDAAGPAVTSARFLASDLAISGSRILDGDANGVMMAWETALMRRSAALLLPAAGLRVLNIGHGMGIIDTLIQTHAPSAHHIVEAHPSVLSAAHQQWATKPGVTLHAGRWQDVLPRLLEQGLQFDAIYFDTFAEAYGALREFFTEHVIALMAPEGRFGFFHGLGADRQVCYDVYTRVVEMDLFEAGLEVEWEDVSIEDLDKDGEWEGVRRKYWALDTYRLPTCRFVG